LLPHHHTSYAGLALVLMLGALALVAADMMTGMTTRAANDITLNGIVAGPPPATAPTIDEPVDGVHVVTSPITVRGHCLPELTVVVSRNGTEAGSGICDNDGRYAIVLDIYDGRNDLTTRQYDELAQGSPVSETVSVYYDSTSAAAPPTPGVITPAGKPRPPAIAGVVMPVVTADYRPGSAIAGESFGLAIAASGGQLPYALSIDWGDGSTDLFSMTAAGSANRQHVYAAAGTYTIRIKLSDAAGRIATTQTVVRVGGATAGTTAKPELPGRLEMAWPVFLVMVMLVVGFWLGEHYDRDRWHHGQAPPKS
jgi:hypothetical protein